MLENDIMKMEIDEQEAVIKVEEKLMEPDSVIKCDGGSLSPPPLRPFTIARKPGTSEIPQALKTTLMINSGSGQQIMLIQASGGATSTVNTGGQPIKLRSAQGPPITVPNLQNVQLTNNSGGMVQLRAVNKCSTINQSTGPTTVGQAQINNKSGTIKRVVPLNKNIVAKIISGRVVLSSQDNETIQSQQIKLVSSVASGTIPATSKTITLAEAQQMGLITSVKLQQSISQSPKKQKVVVKKPIQTKIRKVSPQVKSPIKILPGPVQGPKLQTKQGLQRIIIKQSVQLKPGSMVAGGINQVIYIPASQDISAGQILQINVPGKGVQYIRIMAALTPPSTATTNTSKTVEAQVLPVTEIPVNRTTAVNKSSGSTPAQTIVKEETMNSTQTRPVTLKPSPATNTQAKSNQATISSSALSKMQDKNM